MKKQTPTAKMPPIVEVPIADIKPYENNPRFNEEAIPAVMESLRQFGWQQPVVIAARRGNEIVAGHTRVAAAKALGMKTVPTVDASALTDDQLRAYRLVDNKTAELATWDAFKMDEELAALPDFDMGKFGFRMDADADVAAAFGGLKDGDDEDDGDYRDANKLTIKIPVEHMDRVREWMRAGGRREVIKFVLVSAGCIGADEEPQPEEDDE